MNTSHQRPVRSILALSLILGLVLAGCSKPVETPEDTAMTITDMLGREVEIPKDIQRISGLHHFEGHILFALGQRDKSVHKTLIGLLGQAMAEVDEEFAALPDVYKGHDVSIEALVSLKPDIALVYTSFEKSMMEQMENAGIKVIALRGETLEESYEAIEIVGKILNCEDKAKEYIDYCQGIVDMVKERVSDVPEEERPRVLCTGPKSLFTVATGEMLQSTMVDIAGGMNVASDVKGFWAEVSPEQIATWDPDVIFVGSSLGTYSIEEIRNDPIFGPVTAVKEGHVYAFPSNIGWWDYPAPHCVLGILWSAKTLHPEKFEDIDVTQVADDFYTKFLGHSFTSMGGKL